VLLFRSRFIGLFDPLSKVYLVLLLSKPVNSNLILEMFWVEAASPVRFSSQEIGSLMVLWFPLLLFRVILMPSGLVALSVVVVKLLEFRD
jgi:hypothetical protein